MPVSVAASIEGPFVRLVRPHPLPASLWLSNSLHRHYAFSVMQELSSGANFADLKVLKFSATVLADEEDSHCIYLVGPDLPAVLHAVPELRPFYVSTRLEKLTMETAACCCGVNGHCTANWQESISSASSVSSIDFSSVPEPASPEFFYFDSCSSISSAPTPTASVVSAKTSTTRIRAFRKPAVEDRAVFKAKRSALPDGFVESKRSCKIVSQIVVPLEDLNPFDLLAEPDSDHEHETETSESEIEQSPEKIRKIMLE
jgi:hypothetical protein